jgi:hypothetical protein
MFFSLISLSEKMEKFQTVARTLVAVYTEMLIIIGTYGLLFVLLPQRRLVFQLGITQPKEILET